MGPPGLVEAVAVKAAQGMKVVVVQGANRHRAAVQLIILLLVLLSLLLLLPIALAN